ncbi:MAG: C4-dicarboxylate ABC transporter substrate-binding protein [Deltaproteobacteria bacterium]|nr:C4-dicarboxylate ABC transporter substrate-binding protein [Deltaproteobacteria bacterium]
MKAGGSSGLDRGGLTAAENSRFGIGRLQVIFAETFGLGPGATLTAIIFTAIVVISAAFWFFYSAPPDTIIITSGDAGSLFQRNAERYAKILARKGVKLKILTSEGSLENLKRLEDPKFRVDIGFVQAGVARGRDIDSLVSLGSISYEPLYLFCHADQPFNLLSQFSGRRLAIGEVGTGTNVLALELLALNGIKPGGATTLLEIDDEEAEKALLEGKIDGAFMMGDSASSKTMRDLLKHPRIEAFHFSQADAYARRIRYLSKLVLLEGSIDFGHNVPDHNINLLSPAVELIARKGLHPALSDLLLEAATEVHGRAGRYQRQGEFPAAIEHEYPISPDAQRFYKSGKSFLYRYLPFWMASRLNRILVVIVPMILVLIPGLKSIPVIFRWRMRLRILRWYRALLVLESNLGLNAASDTREELLGRLDRIEQAVNHMKVPASFADQFYSLRSHIAIVRTRLISGTY